MSAALSIGSSMAGPSRHAGPWSKSCGHCRRAYDTRAWEALALVTTIAPVTVQEHLSVPAAWTVELRRCACGSVLAVRRP